MTFSITQSTHLCIEDTAFPGVRRIGDTLAADIAAVTGYLPSIHAQPAGGTVIVCATLGRSAIADALLRAGVLANLSGKREVYQLALTEIDRSPALVICGSDKRGTIYGMFALSEYLGVSPLCFFGDVQPMPREQAVIGKDIETVSKEPSVKYRGFFINDEWPCFGTWATRHYGDVNASCYDRIFQFLLRMKGNYLWPAMWASSFPLDGPGSANEELADLYGVIMGYSHHEPCLRASEEWDKVRGEDSPYGNAWDFDANPQGLSRYWADALKRSGKYENIITIGMRGERDSAILGEGSALGRNIGLLKRVITCQRALIDRHVPRKSIQLLVLYKEVEAYFYGDETTPGLKDWDELQDVLFLLCEDNHGHLRTVPPKAMASHPGGWGMYYHLDYHGGPISYEWVDSTPLVQTWESMTQAWDWGIRELWIVNVGDLKLHEVPLTYFMQLAYDFDTWGTGHPESPEKYLHQWAAQNFPQADAALQEKIAVLVRDYISMNGLRRPEALGDGVYSPHYGELDRMLALSVDITCRSQEIYNALCPREQKAYYSMVHFSAMASANLLRLHLYAGKNHHYAAQGKPFANRYAELSRQCMERDIALAKEFAAFQDGKWAGMELAPHIGFTKWNEDDSRYPVLSWVTPVGKPCMKVSRPDSSVVCTKNYGSPMGLCLDFESPGREKLQLEIANGGIGQLSFTISPAPGAAIPAWLCADKWTGFVTEQETVTFTCDAARLPTEKECCTLLVSDGDTVVALNITGRRENMDALPPMTFVPRDGVISMLASHYCSRKDVPSGRFYLLPHYGKFGSGMKVSPSTAAFAGPAAPGLCYRFWIPASGTYTAEIHTAPNNPVEMGTPVHLGLEVNGTFRTVELLPASFRAGENSDARWCRDVLAQEHTVSTALFFPAGIQELTVYAQEPGVVVEKIVIFLDENLPSAYLGQPESPHC